MDSPIVVHSPLTSGIVHGPDRPCEFPGMHKMSHRQVQQRGRKDLVEPMQIVRTGNIYVA